MTEAILKTALTTDGGKYDPGTIVGVVRPDKKLMPLTMAGFYCLRITTSKYSFNELKGMIKKKVLDLDKLMTASKKQFLLEQKTNAIAFKTNHAKNFPVANANGVSVIIKMHELIHKPDLNTVVDFDKLKIKDTDKKYDPPPTPKVQLYSELDMKRRLRG